MKRLLNGLTTIGMIVFCSFAPNAKGQTTSSSEPSSPATVEAAAAIPPVDYLPVSIPIGNSKILKDYAVSVPLDGSNLDYFTIGLFLKYYNTKGELKKVVSDYSSRQGFASYRDFQELTANQILIGCEGVIAKDPQYNGGDIKYALYFTYITPLAGDRTARSYDSIVFEATLGPLTKITIDSVLKIEPAFLSCLVPVSNLEMVKIEVQSGKPYTNSWTVGKGWERNFPRSTYSDIPYRESGNTNMVSLNGWYASGLYPARITLRSHGQTRVYNEHGIDTSLPNLEIILPDTLKVYTGGQNIVVEQSADNMNWVEITKIPSSSSPTVGIPSTTASVKIDTRSASGFFRARTY